VTTSSATTPPARWSSPRRPDRPTWGPRVAKIAHALGKPLMPWQQHVVDLALEVDPATGRLAYREVRLTVPRQSGKTTLILAKNIWRMADAARLGGRQNLVYVAQTRNKAREKFVDDYLEELTAAPRLKGRWTKRLSNGSESIRWENGSRWGIESTTEKAGHGPTLDVGDIDEAFAQIDDRAEQAMKPAMITRPQPQLWVVSTAGTEDSLYLNDKVDTGREFAQAGIDRGVCYIEWSAPDGADPADPATWWTCMPALGHTVTQEAVAADFASMKLAEFSRAYLNWKRPKAFGEQVIDAEKWAACQDPASQLDGGPAVFAVDVSPGAGSAAIAVAGYRSDGLPHIEVIDYRDGDDWVTTRVVDLRDRWGSHIPVLLDPASPAAALIPDLVRGGVEPQLVNGRQLAQACAYLKSTVLAGGIRVLAQDVVDRALASAVTRKLLDAWAWNRGPSAADICPLVALTLAAWALSTQPADIDYPIASSIF
jgi:hypothetical protein